MQFFLQLFYEMSLSAEEVLFIFLKKRCAERQLVMTISMRNVMHGKHGKHSKTLVNIVVVVLLRQGVDSTCLIDQFLNIRKNYTLQEEHSLLSGS